jgi:hypothetical protein
MFVCIYKLLQFPAGDLYSHMLHRVPTQPGNQGNQGKVRELKSSQGKVRDIYIWSGKYFLMSGKAM